jgi:hypothetical protein
LGNLARKIWVKLRTQQVLHLHRKNRWTGEKRKENAGTKPNRSIKNADASKEADHGATLGERATSVEGGNW